MVHEHPRPRRFVRATLLASACALALAGCRTPPPGPEALALYDAALDLLLERSARIQRIGQTVSINGAEVCPSLGPVAGMAVLRVNVLKGPLGAAAQRRFGAERGVFVTAVFEGLPASLAGVRTGDRLVEVEGSAPRGPRLSMGSISTATAPLFLPSREAPTLELRVERAGREIDLALPVRAGCAYPVALARNDSVNAFAWRKQIVMLTGLLRFTRRDSALALVVGHEIGHVALGHTRRRVSSLRAERDADYLGAYLAARAGFDLTEEDYALLRLSYEDPTRLSESEVTTHPSGPERQLAFEHTLAEIAEKRIAGVALIPEGLE